MFQIVTDSAADLTPEDIAENQIVVAPLKIEFPDGTVSSEEIGRDEFYARLKSMWPSIPSTSLPSPDDFVQIYQRLAKNVKPILSIHISSGLSSTMSAAHIGAESVPEAQVTHIDSMTLSGGLRFQVLAAAAMVRAGKPLELIQEQLGKIRQATETVYTLETMEYLAKGGRIGRVQALAGILLNIKPVIHVNHTDGKYSPVGRERTIPRALDALNKHLGKLYASESVWVSVMHGQAGEYAEELANGLRKTLNIAKLEILRISPVLGVHTGPGIIGAAVCPANLLTA